MNYEHGLPFSEKLGQNVMELIDRIQHKKASLIIIDGGLGEGKTTLGVHIADYINKAYGLPEIELEDQLALGGKDFTAKLRLCHDKMLPAIIYDEAGDFNRRGALTSFNMMINRVFEMFRAYQIFVILCLPSFHVIDNDLFMKNIPRLLLHLKNRGAKWGDIQAYSLYRMLYVKHKMEKLIVKGFAYSMVEPNFYSHFLDLEPERSKRLDRYSIKGKKDNLIQAEIKLEGLHSYQDLAKKLGRSLDWVRRKANELKIKRVKIIKRVKYFNDNQLNRMADYLDEHGYKKSKR